MYAYAMTHAFLKFFPPALVLVACGLTVVMVQGCADPGYHGYLNEDEPLGYYEVQAAGSPFYFSGPGPGFYGGGGFYGGPGYYSGMPYGPYGGGWW
ncbi:MAG: hypothetical protein RIQ52_1001 [Pseudomonadota bacterium]|jgi:hypothetical protein